jgi:hypothetical protein
MATTEFKQKVDEWMDGGRCPSCGSGDFPLDQTYFDEEFNLFDGGWFTEWYRCDCGCRFGISQRFVPASDEFEITVEE